MPGPSSDDEEFLTSLNAAMADRPLDLTNKADQQLYVPLYEQVPPEEDPVRLLANQIRRSRTSATVHLFSGYRGSGKSTELRRLQNSLAAAGYDVLYLDMDGYLDPHTPVGIGDYLLDVAGALDDELRTARGVTLPAEPFWGRVSGWFKKWQFEVDEVYGELGVDAGLTASVGLKAALKENPEFRKRLSRYLAGRLEVVVREVHGFVAELADAARGGPGVVLLVDSTEKLSDTEESGDSVKGSVRTLFAQHAARLRLPGVHTVYSIPPDLPIREPRAVSTSYDGAMWSLTAVTVERGDDPSREEAGIQAMLDVLWKRAPDVGRLVASEGDLRELVVASGGNLRNLLFLVRQVIGRAFTVPASRAAVDGAVRQLASDFRWLTAEEKEWLKPIVDHRRPRLDDEADRIRFADFLDRQVVLPHRNGEDWFDIAKPVRDLL